MDDVTHLSSTEQQLWDLYSAFSRLLDSALERSLRSHGISSSDYRVLQVVACDASDQVRVRDIGESAGWESSRLAHQLRRMQQRGLIERAKASDDARGTVVRLTPVGSDIFEKAQPDYRSALRETFTAHVPHEAMRMMCAQFANLVRRAHAGAPPAASVPSGENHASTIERTVVLPDTRAHQLRGSVTRGHSTSPQQQPQR